MFRVLTALACVAVLAAGVPAAAGRSVQVNFPGGVFIEEGWGRIQVRFSKDGRTLKFESRGDFDLVADESDLARLESGGLFRIEERRHGRTQRRFVARGLADGGIGREFEFRGDRREMTADDRIWLQKSLESVLSHTTFAAESHVAHLLAQGGPERALAAIAAMPSDHVQSVHYRELLSQRAGEPETAAQAVRQAGESIGSDHDLGLVLRAAMEHSSDARDVARACAQGSASIGGDHERRLVLQAVLDGSGADPGVSEAVAQSALGIGSDHERAEVLLALVQHHPSAVTEAPSFFAATSGIGSDHERARVLIAIVTGPQVPPNVLIGVLESARGMGSDHERGRLLVELAANQQVEGPVRSEYLETARSLGSNHWRESALVAVSAPADLSDR